MLPAIGHVDPDAIRAALTVLFLAGGYVYGRWGARDAHRAVEASLRVSQVEAAAREAALRQECAHAYRHAADASQLAAEVLTENVALAGRNADLLVALARNEGIRRALLETVKRHEERERRQGTAPAATNG